MCDFSQHNPADEGYEGYEGYLTCMRVAASKLAATFFESADLRHDAYYSGTAKTELALASLSGRYKRCRAELPVSGTRNTRVTVSSHQRYPSSQPQRAAKRRVSSAGPVAVSLSGIADKLVQRARLPTVTSASAASAWRAPRATYFLFLGLCFMR